MHSKFDFRLPFVLPFLLLFLIRCGGGGKQYENGNPQIPAPLNVVLLLDLSDRVKTEGQVAKDKRLIAEILDAFEQRQRQFKYQHSNDLLTVYLPHQEGDNNPMFNLSHDLNIEMKRKPDNKMNAPFFKEKKAAFLAQIDALYASALQNPTTGADIWSFFRNKRSAIQHAPLYDTIAYLNRALVITDGYLQFDQHIASNRLPNTYMSNVNLTKLRNEKSNWKAEYEKSNLALLPHEPFDADAVQAFIFEVSPHHEAVNTEELEILKHFWSDWLGKMNVKTTLCESAQQTQATYELVEKVLNPPLVGK